MPPKKTRARPSSETEQPKTKVAKTEPSSSSVPELKYLSGFGGHHQSEALPDAIPKRGFMPQKAPYGLYAEQLSGTSFTTPRLNNARSWMYRIQPSCLHKPMVAAPQDGKHIVGDFASMEIDPNQTRWQALPLPTEPTDFVQGLVTYAGCGSAESKRGLAIHLYAFNTDMGNRVMCNSDGDFLIVPQLNTLNVRTEFGRLSVEPMEFVVIPRGVKFQVSTNDGGPARGYVCEIFDGHPRLPELGPIGSNGLANAQDFKYPTAEYEDTVGHFVLVQKFLGKIFHGALAHSPFDIRPYRPVYLHRALCTDHRAWCGRSGFCGVSSAMGRSGRYVSPTILPQKLHE
jgi:homogentisate 1,2-dioxygenase